MDKATRMAIETEKELFRIEAKMNELRIKRSELIDQIPSEEMEIFYTHTSKMHRERDKV